MVGTKVFFLFSFFKRGFQPQFSAFSKEILLSATLFLYLQIIFTAAVVMEKKALV